MPKAILVNMAGTQVGEVELSEAVFGIEPNQTVVHEVVKNHLANCRQGTQSALTRAEVSGGGIKPWRQKGTGRARQGSTRAPQWTHGGIVFAPKPRDYSYVLNKKVKRLALKSAHEGLPGYRRRQEGRRRHPRGERDRHQVRPEHPRRGHHHRQDPERLRHRERRKVYR